MTRGAAVAADPVLARRRALVREIEAARAALEGGFPELHAAAEEARVALEAAQRGFQALGLRLRNARGAVSMAEHVAEGHIRAAHEALAESADPRIAALLADAEDQLHWARRYPPLGVRPEVYGARLAELMAAGEEIGALRYLALTADDLDERLAALRARLAALPGPPRPAA